ADHAEARGDSIRSCLRATRGRASRGERALTPSCLGLSFPAFADCPPHPARRVLSHPGACHLLLGAGRLFPASWGKTTLREVLCVCKNSPDTGKPLRYRHNAQGVSGIVHCGLGRSRKIVSSTPQSSRLEPDFHVDDACKSE